MKHFADIAFTPAVQALQAKHGSRDTYARMQRESEPRAGLGPREAEYLAVADSFYLASVGATGWPYVQHRGGPPGFLRVLSPTRLAFADFRGNRQFVSAGNTEGDARVSLIVMDYANRRRLKLLGRLTFTEVSAAHPGLAAAVELPHYRARVERVALIDVEAFDWNCPQHITPRFTEAEMSTAIEPIVAELNQLRAELAALRAGGDRHEDVT